MHLCKYDRLSNHEQRDQRMAASQLNAEYRCDCLAGSLEHTGIRSKKSRLRAM